MNVYFVQRGWQSYEGLSILRSRCFEEVFWFADSEGRKGRDFPWCGGVMDV